MGATIRGAMVIGAVVGLGLSGKLWTSDKSFNENWTKSTDVAHVTSSSPITTMPSASPLKIVPLPQRTELRFANRFYVGGNYRQREEGIRNWLPGSSAIANYNEGYHIERHSRYFNSAEECEKAKSRMEKNNPNLWWARCR